VEDEWSVLGRSSIPDSVCQQMLRHTEPGVHETGMLQVLVLARIRGRRWGTARFHTAIGRQVHTCGMEVCELTAVAIAAPLPPPWSLRRAQASTSPRLA
jgi:hypothetical protein